jgi:hypothetical protein
MHACTCLGSSGSTTTENVFLLFVAVVMISRVVTQKVARLLLLLSLSLAFLSTPMLFNFASLN